LTVFLKGGKIYGNEAETNRQYFQRKIRPNAPQGVVFLIKFMAGTEFPVPQTNAEAGCRSRNSLFTFFTGQPDAERR
jgi:hypothetical protein